MLKGVLKAVLKGVLKAVLKGVLKGVLGRVKVADTHPSAKHHARVIFVSPR